jgi:hypothetical protein
MSVKIITGHVLSALAQLARLRARIDDLTSREAISNWLDDAVAVGMDPL